MKWWKASKEERLQQFLEADGIGEEKKQSVFLSMVGPKTFALLKDLVESVKLGEGDLGVLWKALKDFYSPKMNVLTERYTFRNQKQLVDKTLAEYIAALKELATTCSFGNMLEEQLPYMTSS